MKINTKKRLFSKLLTLLLIVIVLSVVVCMFLAFPVWPPKQPQWGVTFSVVQAEGLGLNWKEVYTSLLSELGVKHLRLIANWDVIEPTEGVYNFRVLDEQMDLAALHQADVVLAIGRKLPRWPECYTAPYATSLSEAQQQQRILELLAVIVKRYQQHPALSMWQVENEPLLAFGVCPPASPSFLREEVQLVHSLDTHPVLITDSGELHWWLNASSYGDVFGTTLYRTVFSQRTQQPFSYDYIYPAWLYRLKGRLVYLINGKQTIISELQGEPWGSKATIFLSAKERAQSFSLDRFKKNENFAARTQFGSAYWWGVEYWYWEKIHEGNPAFWEEAKNIFRNK